VGKYNLIFIIGTLMPRKKTQTVEISVSEQRRINAPSIALLQSWLSTAPTTSEETKEAEKDLLEFKQSINLNRSESGQKPAYPGVQK
jgi:hypothetical protein